MANNMNPRAFKACYATFQKQDSDRHTFITQLLEEYDILYMENMRMAEQFENENMRMAEQLENEKEMRLMFQNHARAYKAELNQLKLATVRLPCPSQVRPSSADQMPGVTPICRHDHRRRWR